MTLKWLKFCYTKLRLPFSVRAWQGSIVAKGHDAGAEAQTLSTLQIILLQLCQGKLRSYSDQKVWASWRPFQVCVGWILEHLHEAQSFCDACDWRISWVVSNREIGKVMNYCIRRLVTGIYSEEDTIRQFRLYPNIGVLICTWWLFCHSAAWCLGPTVTQVVCCQLKWDIYTVISKDQATCKSLRVVACHWASDGPLVLDACCC